MVCVPTTVSVVEAKQQFSALLARAEAGEEIVIARHGKPVVTLVAVRRRPDRVLGGARDVITVAADFDETSSEEVDRWYSSADE